MFHFGVAFLSLIFLVSQKVSYGWDHFQSLISVRKSGTSLKAIHMFLIMKLFFPLFHIEKS